MEGLKIRLKKELEKFISSPPEGISCHLREGTTNILDASIIGVKGTPYEDGEFHLEISLPFKYPFAPPNIKFKTPIYHPNIDDGGRICLNLLKMPPSGSWRCALTIVSLLTSIQALMCAPNPDDPLMPEIAEEFKLRRHEFEAKAKEWTQKYCFHMELRSGDVPKASNAPAKRKCSPEEGESSTKKAKCDEEMKMMVD